MKFISSERNFRLQGRVFLQRKHFLWNFFLDKLFLQKLFSFSDASDEKRK